MYLIYEKYTKQVVEIVENEPTIQPNYDFCISDEFKVGDEFELTIWINSINENRSIESYSAIRNNPNAARLLRENEELKQDKKMLNLKVDALTSQNEMLESVVQELIMTVIP